MNVIEIFETMDYGPAPEAAAPGLAWIKEHEPFGLFINNQWVKPASGQYIESINPATGKPLTKVAAANSADVGTRACWLCWNRWIMANLSAKHVTSIFRLLRAIFTTMPVGRNSWNCNFLTTSQWA